MNQKAYVIYGEIEDLKCFCLPNVCSNVWNKVLSEDIEKVLEIFSKFQDII